MIPDSLGGRGVGLQVSEDGLLSSRLVSVDPTCDTWGYGVGA